MPVWKYASSPVSAYQAVSLSLDGIRNPQSLPAAMIEPFFNWLSIVSGSGTDAVKLLRIGFGIAMEQAVVTSSGDSGPVAAILTPLGTGADQLHQVGFPISINQAIINRVGWFLITLQKIIDSLIRGDNVNVKQLILAGLPDEVKARQKILCLLSDRQLFPMILKNTLSDDDVSAFQKLAMSIAEHNDVRTFQKLAMALYNPIARFYSTVGEIYLDGRPLSRRFVTAEFLYDENNVHNSLTLTSADPELFVWANPAILPGEPRLEVHVGARLIYFIIDTRPGERSDFTINAISVSAKEDGPLTEEIDFSMTEAMLASEVAAGLAVYCPVVWQAHDWVVPADFAFFGYPLDGIQMLAAEVGAVVRCQDDGSLLVRPRRPVRPIDMDVADAVVDYTHDVVISLSQTDQVASGYNAVEVTGRIEDVYIPELMLETVEDGPYQGQVVYMRAYWAGNPVIVDSNYVTDGEIVSIGGGRFYYQDVEEIVEFQNGKASVDLPVYQLLGYAWIGDSGGSVSWTRHGKDLIVPGGGFRIARVKYRAQYQRYKISGHDVVRLIAVLFLNLVNEVRVLVRTADDPVWAPPISAPLLTDTAAAVARGMAEIDAWKYPKSVLSVECPHDDAVIDGVIVHINDDEIGHPGNHHVISNRVVFDGPKITNVLGLEKCLTF